MLKLSDYPKSQELAERIFLKNLDECLRYPKYLQIETTNKCNAKCTMCPHSYEIFSGKTMSNEIYGKILKDISSHIDWIESVALYHFGEPLLDSEICDRAEMLKNIGIRNIQISTNVELLSPRKAEELMRKGVNDLRLSIDAATKTTYEDIRKGLHFDTVMRNALDALEIRNKYFKGKVKIRVRCVEMNSNRNELGMFIDFWKSKLSEEDKVQIIPSHTKEGWSIGENISHSDNVPCISIFSTLKIDVNGDVALCCCDTARNKKTIMGNIQEDSIGAIWNTRLFNEIRNIHLSRGRGGYPPCKGCDMWDKTYRETAD